MNKENRLCIIKKKRIKIIDGNCVYWDILYYMMKVVVSEFFIVSKCINKIRV